MSEKDGRIFISYSTQDSSTAEEIVEALKRINLSPWIDREQIEPGESFIQRMNEGLGAASYVVVLLSGASLKSRHVSREWMSTLARENTVLIPMKIAPCEIPILLKDILHIDLTTDRKQGLERLIDFFKKELTPGASGSITRSGEPSAALLEGVSRRDIRLVCMNCLDDIQFKSFLHDADIPEGRISGSSLHERILNLLHIVGTDGILKEFLDWLVIERGRCIANQLKIVRSQPRWQI